MEEEEGALSLSLMELEVEERRRGLPLEAEERRRGLLREVEERRGLPMPSAFLLDLGENSYVLYL